MELGNTLAVAAEANEKGLLKDGVKWGDVDRFAELVKQIAHREGELGNILAEGGTKAAKLLGDPDLSMSVKGMSIPAYDPRGLKGFALAYSVSPRGVCHLRAYTPASEILGIPYKTDPLATEGKVDLVMVLERLFAFSDSLHMCKFSSFALGPEDYADLFATFTGIEMTLDELFKVGERIITQERYFNQLHRITRKDDRLPKRFMKELASSGPSKGHVIDEATLNSLLDEYYRKHGWNPDGTVPAEILRQLAIA
ncbi:MAG: aldehyde ferredoxin oxidoreductase C-terminal domain-containing protein [Candidatus Caldarchaeum sp.]